MSTLSFFRKLKMPAPRLAAFIGAAVLAGCNAASDGTPGMGAAAPADRNGSAESSAIRFRQTGDYPATTVGTGSGAGGAVSADFNGDGHPDLAFADPFGLAVSVLLNQGDGTFGKPVKTALTGDAYAVAVGDFDQDGRPDLVVASELLRGVIVLHGQGDGSFTVGAQYSTGLLPQQIVVADFNRDGISDLAVLNGTQSISILMGKGNGEFAAATQIASGLFTSAMAAGDVDGDGITDLIYADGPTAAVTVLRGKGDGSFSPTGSFPLGGFPESIAAGDLNGDGLTDIVSANVGDLQSGLAGLAANPPLNPVDTLQHDSFGSGTAVLLADGKGGFLPPVIYPAGASPTAVAISDFNGDGIPDLTAGTFRSNELLIYAGTGAGKFATPDSYPISGGPQIIVVGDFDGDHLPDLALPGGLGASSVLIFQNQSAP